MFCCNYSAIHWSSSQMLIICLTQVCQFKFINCWLSIYGVYFGVCIKLQADVTLPPKLNCDIQDGVQDCCHNMWFCIFSNILATSWDRNANKISYYLNMLIDMSISLMIFLLMVLQGNWPFWSEYLEITKNSDWI